MDDHKPRQCVPWCGNPDCVHVDAIWNRRDPWNRSTAEIHALADSPLGQAIGWGVVGLFAIIAFYGLFFCN